MLAVCCAGLIAEDLKAQEARQRAASLTVRLYNYANVPGGVLADAEEVTVRVLREAGIELSWAPCAVSDLDYENSPAKFAACAQASDAPIVRIEAESGVPQNLGYRVTRAAAALEDRVAIFYDKVRQVSADHGISAATVLGHVMAHEVGHVLLGENSHSADGIMIATFREQELRRAESGNLLFSARQAAHMRASVRGIGLRAGVDVGSKK